jgi:hypothetical protein
LFLLDRRDRDGGGRRTLLADFMAATGNCQRANSQRRNGQQKFVTHDSSPFDFDIV